MLLVIPSEPPTCFFCLSLFSPSLVVSIFLSSQVLATLDEKQKKTPPNVSFGRSRAGLAGSYVGQQMEARIRWDILPGNCRLDTGVATLFKGSFLQNAPNANANGDTLYAWVEWTVTF